MFGEVKVPEMEKLRPLKRDIEEGEECGRREKDEQRLERRFGRVGGRRKNLAQAEQALGILRHSNERLSSSY